MTVCADCNTELDKQGLRGPQSTRCGPCLRVRKQDQQKRWRDANRDDYNRRQRERRAVAKDSRVPPAPEVCTCEQCGVAFERRSRKGVKPSFCSLCRAFRFACSIERRRAVMADGEDFTAAEIFERDGNNCQSCGQPCIGEYPAPYSPSVDHQVPIARGGRHVRSNVQTMHLLCNLQKSANVS